MGAKPRSAHAIGAAVALVVLLGTGCAGSTNRTDQPDDASSKHPHTSSVDPEPSKSPSPEPSPSSTPSPTSTRWTEDDIEYQLASLDFGELLAHDDPDIARYATALDGAEAECREGRRRIGDMTVVAKQSLDEERPGHGETLMTLLTALVEGAEGTRGQDRCAELYGAMLTLMLD
jgi:hypothetical protein